MDLSLVIVTWNAKRYVAECLASLRQPDDEGSREIVVVDNASSDGTAELIADEFPRVRLVRNSRNLGFAAANNIGIRLTQGKYVCLVNSDVNVAAGCLEQMVQYLEHHPDIGLLGPLMLGPDGTPRRSSMRFPTVWNTFCCALALDRLFGRTKLWGGFLMRDFNHDRTVDVDVLNGWFWMARRSALSQVGLLDERFFMYGEDIDWCHRFHRSSWRVVFYPNAAAVHYGGASSSNAPIKFYVEMQRANLQYWRKHHPLTSWGFVLTSGLHHLIRIVGYGSVYLLKRSQRSEAAFKVSRSVASLLWLSGFKRAPQTN